MKKILILILMLLNVAYASEITLRDYEEYEIPTGTHIPVISLQEFSTAYCEEGDRVNFKTTTDIYLFNKNVIPEGTLLQGYIDKKNEPIIGTHASMKVFINRMVMPNGSKYPIKAYIYTANNNLIGGGLTLPAKYIKIPHYQRWSMFRAVGTLQYVPGAERRMGEHITITSGADLIVVLVAPIHTTYTLMN